MARKSRKNIETTAVQEVKTVYSVGAYIRLSAVDKKHKGDSIETQQAIIEAFIAEHSDMELREVYIDNGLSGQTFERPAFQQMLADMELGKINCCAVKDLSRLGRNAIDSGYYVEKYFPTNSIRFVAITDNYDSADGASGGIILSLKNMVNESYALDIGRKIRATKQMHIRNGGFVGRFPPYGYLKSPQDCYKLIPDNYSSEIVRKMFDMAVSGQGVSAILTWLNADEILPPKRYFHSIGLATEKEARGVWNKAVIYSILKNRIYCGDMVQGKTKLVNQVSVKVAKSEWVVTENTHDALVSRELFAEVQALWEKTNTTPISKYNKPKTDNIFLRKVFCGHCGYTMLRSRTSEKQYSFKCHTQQARNKSICVAVSINENDLKEQLLNLLRKQNFDSPIISTNNSANELSSVKAELAKMQNFLKGLYESLILGDITDSEYKELKSGYETKITKLKTCEKQLRESNYHSVQADRALSQANDSVRGIKSVSDLTAEVIDKLIEKIYVYENKRIAIKFRFAEEVQAYE